jgi:hypothetical protein
LDRCQSVQAWNGIGARDAAAEEVARSLRDFFVSNDVSNRLANAKNSLRNEIIAGSDIAAEVASEFLERKLESARPRK